MNVLMFAVLTTILMVTGIQFTQASLKEGQVAGLEQQAYQVALAGVNHAVMWLQIHRGESPTTFDPRLVPTEPDFSPETSASDEPFGIVQEYELDSVKKLWARYEVGRSLNAPIRDTLTTQGPVSALYPAGTIDWTCEDVGLARGGASGSAWRARSRGYVFRRENASDPFVLTPKPARSVLLEGVVRNITFDFPRAALYSFKNGADAGTHVAINYTGTAGAGNTEVSNEGQAGTYHLQSNTASSKVSLASGVRVSGGGSYSEASGCTNSSYANYVNPDLGAQLQGRFGAPTADAIVGVADADYEAVADVPNPIKGMQFVYLNPGGTRGTATFNAAKPLRGGGLLFVDGSLVITGTTAVNHYWNGVIFVTGHYTQSGNSTVTGSVLAGQTITVGGADSSKARVLYSQDVIDRVKEKFSGFRIDRATLKVVRDPLVTF